MEMTPTPKKKMTLGRKILIGLGVLIVLGIIANSGKDKKNSSASSSSSSESTSPAASTTSIGIGQTLKTDYFEVTVSKAQLTKQLNTGNEFTDASAGKGNQYLVMTTTFKNIDNESRMITDGTIYITYNDKEYTFDKSETIMAEGFGLFLDQLNPLTSKTTKLVYKLPLEIKGPAYYKPGRAGDNERIYLGDLK